MLPHGDHYVNPVFLFAAGVSLGALAVSGFFAWAAMAGIRSCMRFHKSEGTFRILAGAPVNPLRVYEHPLESILRLEMETHEWSDGPPSYPFKVEMADGRQFTTATSWSHPEGEGIKRRVEAFLGRSCE